MQQTAKKQNDRGWGERPQATASLLSYLLLLRHVLRLRAIAPVAEALIVVGRNPALGARLDRTAGVVGFFGASRRCCEQPAHRERGHSSDHGAHFRYLFFVAKRFNARIEPLERSNSSGSFMNYNLVMIAGVQGKHCEILALAPAHYPDSNADDAASRSPIVVMENSHCPIVVR
jgi:hypothetical protein